jgi:hypothetical protein
MEFVWDAQGPSHPDGEPSTTRKDLLPSWFRRSRLLILSITVILTGYPTIIYSYCCVFPINKDTGMESDTGFGTVPVKKSNMGCPMLLFVSELLDYSRTGTAKRRLPFLSIILAHRLLCACIDACEPFHQMVEYA